MYEGIHHVSLLVTNLKKSKYFYEEILGLKESKDRPDFDFPGAWYEVGHTQIHLIIHNEGNTLRGTTKLDSRDGHFAIRVSNIDKFINRMNHYGVSILNKPNSITGWHQVFVSDPDGNLIEFNYSNT
ncbi:catechol 2,3-dioxygenase-like lactoylglutathione lyase family enzyme [Salirhabdus euzebyi]|uniref:Catechol 2,3-dioxygenase-like lactoylglutathione lyase family enzyme n=1 Tax=Salirhabdus euzebyi TaxID=394506 RepID=A0A841PU48_9BACI|nr:VOC family protein [Salirhabdus euzebyi]MBB6452369.1 catechol 2,3-dioxygenase-like lactoylglutathione lyase family enzyme [Salirhabdus euzebyi]